MKGELKKGGLIAKEGRKEASKQAITVNLLLGGLNHSFWASTPRRRNGLKTLYLGGHDVCSWNDIMTIMRIGRITMSRNWP